MSGRPFHFKFLSIYIFVLLIFFSVHLQGAGTNSFTFLQMQIGSRAQGMGNAFTAISSHINGLYYNPASSAFSPRPSMMLYHSNWIEDISIENISFIYPNVQKFSFSTGLSYLHLPAIDEYDINNTTGEAIRNGTFQIYNLISHIGISYQASENFSAGVQFKFLQERIADVTASGFAFDFGLLFKAPVDYLSFGVAIQNLGPKMKYDHYKEKIPLTFRLGVAYQLPYNPFTFAFDVVKTSDENWNFYPGMELEVMKGLAFRGGYQFQKDIGAGYNVGIGFEILDNYSINYVFSPYGILGNTHRAEFVFNFGNLYRKSKPAPRESYPTDFTYSSYASQLPIPKNLKAVQVGEEILLSWSTSYIRNAQYNIYVEIPGRTGIVKINKVPLRENSYTFQPTVSKLSLKFYISLVTNKMESDKSKPVELKFQK